MLSTLFACEAPGPDGVDTGAAPAEDTSQVESDNDTGVPDSGVGDSGAGDSSDDDTSPDDSGADDTGIADSGTADSGIDDTAVEDTGSPEALADFSLEDLNPGSARFGEDVSPRDYLERVSGWYFIHAT